MNSQPDDRTATQSHEERTSARLCSAPPEVPGYSLKTLCGEGSFGEVWLGTQVRTGLQVAVKFIRVRGSAWANFRSEVERLSLVSEHPNIVKLLDADLEVDEPYFIMHHYPDTLSNQTGAEVDKVVGWMDQVGRALRHTHRRGLLHCDLKPSNILLDVEGQAQLADFGQSVLRDSDHSSLGSLGFMAPEQALPEAVADVRWDVYALGASIYFLLTGQTPRSAKNLESYAEDRQSLVGVRRLNPKVDPDLAALVEACLDLDPEGRPDSMEAVLEDLERRRKRLPLLCRQPWNAGYVGGRFLKRNALATIFSVLLLCGGLLLVRQFLNTRSMLAEQNFRLGWSLYEQGEEAEALLWWAEAVELAPRVAAYSWPGRSYGYPLVAVFEHQPGLEKIVFNGKGDQLLAAGSDGSARLFQVSDGQLLAEVPSQNFQLDRDPLFERGFDTCDFSPDGTSFVVAGRPARVWKSQTLQDLPMDALTACFSPDGSSILLGGLEEASIVRGEQVLKLPHGEPVGGASFSPDGKWVVTFGGASVQLWDAANGQPGPRFKNGGAPFFCAEFDSQSRCLVGGSADGALVWDLAGNQKLKIYAPDPVMAAGFDRQAKKLALGCVMGQLGVWDAHKGQALFPPVRFRWSITGTHFLPDDQRLLASSYQGLARLWDSTDGKPASPSLLNDGQLRSTALSSDGGLLATGSADGSIRVYRLGALNLMLSEIPVDEEADPKIFVRLSPDGTRVAGLKGGWDTAKGTKLWDALPYDGSPYMVDTRFSADGGRLVLGGKEPRVYEDGHPVGVPLPKTQSGYFGATLSPDGQRVLSLGYDNRLQLWDVSSGRELATAQQDVFPVFAAFRPDGDMIAVGSVDEKVRIYDTELNEVASVSHGLFVSALNYSPDGTLLATGCGDGSVRLWEIDGKRLLASTVQHDSAVTWMDFDPTGDLLASISLDGEVRVSDREGRLLLPPFQHPNATTLAFGKEGLVTASGASVRTWDVSPPGEESAVQARLKAQQTTGRDLNGPLSPAQWMALK